MRKKIVALFVAIALIVASVPAFGGESPVESIPVDVLVVRPLTLVATVVGTAIFVVGLLFSIPSQTVGYTAQKLIVEPFKFTFTRPVGEFDDQKFYYGSN
jgi:hypothetical protein